MTKTEEIQIARDQARDLRMRGKNYSEISKRLNITPEWAFAYVHDSVALPSQKKAMAVERGVAAARLDLAVGEAIGILEDLSESTDTRLKAIVTLVALEGRRAKLLGLDAPERLIAAMASLEEAPEEQRTPAKAAEVMRRAFGLVGPATDTGDIVAHGEIVVDGDPKPMV